MLAQELNSLLKENTSSRGPAQALFEDCLVNDRSRPLLLITDRISDLFPVLQHASTYQVKMYFACNVHYILFHHMLVA